jgi:hypothetical protein
LDTYAHNIVAQLLAEFGMLGVLSLLLVVAMCLLCVWRNRQELGAADALLLAWLGVIGTYSLLEYPLWYVHFLMFFALTLGLLVRPAWRLWTVQVRARLLVGWLSSAALAVCLGLFNDYRDLDRLMFLVLQKVENRIASSPEVNALVASADAEVAIYRTHADHMRGLAMSMTKEELAEKVEATDKLLSWAPTPPAIARRAVLAVLSEDQATAGYHLERLQRFFPRQAGELVEQMRLMAAERPAELGTLARLLDSNAASASQGRR